MTLQHIGEAARNVAEKAAERAEYLRATKAERIAEGVRLYGWRPDADCANCGDTGLWPNSSNYCGCPAGTAKQIRDRDARSRSEWERRWVLTNVPRRFQGYRLETSPLDAMVVDVARRWISRDPVDTGINLLITGSVGVGKTGLAIGALWELHERGVQPLWFVSTSALIDAMRPNSGEDGMLATCQKASVLVLDDLGTTRGTDWEQDRLFALLNARYEEQRPTIVTTNVEIAELAASIGERSVSRLLEQHVIVAVDGPDRRLVTA